MNGAYGCNVGVRAREYAEVITVYSMLRWSGDLAAFKIPRHWHMPWPTEGPT